MLAISMLIETSWFLSIGLGTFLLASIGTLEPTPKLGVIFSILLYILVGWVIHPIFTSNINDITLSIEQIVLYLSIYFITGAIYSVIRWWIFLISWKHKYYSITEKLFIEAFKHNAKPIEFTIDNLREHLENSNFYPSSNIKIPFAKYNKDTIISWIVFWPISVISWALLDLVIDISTLIYKKLINVYDYITIKTISSVFNSKLKD